MAVQCYHCHLKTGKRQYGNNSVFTGSSCALLIKTRGGFNLAMPAELKLPPFDSNTTSTSTMSWPKPLSQTILLESVGSRTQVLSREAPLNCSSEFQLVHFLTCTRVSWESPTPSQVRPFPASLSEKTLPFSDTGFPELIFPSTNSGIDPSKS